MEINETYDFFCVDADANNEDYTNEFKIDIYEEEE